jgi:hypothetical protein
MDAQELMLYLETPEAHSRVLAGYRGPYSLGIGEEGGQPVVVLHVQGKPALQFPPYVYVGTTVVPLQVVTDLAAPQAFETTGY